MATRNKYEFSLTLDPTKFADLGGWVQMSVGQVMGSSQLSEFKFEGGSIELDKEQSTNASGSTSRQIILGPAEQSNAVFSKCPSGMTSISFQIDIAPGGTPGQLNIGLTDAKIYPDHMKTTAMEPHSDSFGWVTWGPGGVGFECSSAVFDDAYNTFEGVMKLVSD